MLTAAVSPVDDFVYMDDAGGTSGQLVTYDIQTGQESFSDTPMYQPGPIAQYETADTMSPVETSSNNGGVEEALGTLTKVSSPETYPRRVNVKIFATFSNGLTYVGSGTMIDPMHVITAGHVVHDLGDGGWATSVRVVPAYEDGDAPYADAHANQLHSWEGWTVDVNHDHDIAVIDLDRPIGALVGWHGYGYHNDPSFFTGTTFNNYSYPSESPYDGQFMYYQSGDFDSTEYSNGSWSGNEIRYDARGYRGQSGSSFYRLSNDSRVVYAVLSNGNSSSPYYTDAVRLTQGKFNSIQGWLDDDRPSSFDLIPLDVSFGTSSITAGQQLSGVNYLLHNYSTASVNQTVTVDVYISTNDNISTSDTKIDTHTVNLNLSARASTRVTVSDSITIPSNLATGTYYIGIIVNGSDANTGNNDTDGDDAQSISVTAIPPDFDDQISEAITAGFGTYTGTISGSFDVDMWSVTVAAGDQVTFALNTPSSSLDPEIRLFDYSGSQLAIDDDGGPGTDSLISHTFNSAGTYYLGVAVYDNNGYDPITGNGDNGTANGGAYELVVTHVDSNDQISEAITAGFGTYTGTISSSNDVDMWSVTVGAGDEITFALNTPTSDLDPEIRLFNSSGLQLAINDDGGPGTDSLMTYAFSVAGTYYLGVAAYDNDGYDPITGGGDNGTAGGGAYELVVTLQIPPLNFGSDIFARAGGNWWVARSNGTDGFNNEHWGSWDPNAGWQDVNIADVDGDGDHDIVGRNSNGQWWVARNTGTGFSSELWGFWVPTAGWQDVLIADVDGDGDSDIVGRSSIGDWWVARSNGVDGFSNESWGRWSTSVSWKNVMVADLDGDGDDDIIGQSANGQWWSARSSGTSFATQLWGYWANSANWRDVQVGDVNGDGNDDVVGRTQTGQWWVALSNGSNGFTNQRWGGWAEAAGWNDVMVGDLNGDGNDDIIGRTNNGQWWAAQSTGSAFTTEYWGYWVNLGWQDVSMIDVDRDGNADVVGRNSSGYLWVARSNGNDSFSNQLWGRLAVTNWQNVMVGNTSQSSASPLHVNFEDDDEDGNVFSL